MLEFILIVVLATGQDIRKPATASDCVRAEMSWMRARWSGKVLAARDLENGEPTFRRVVAVRCEPRQEVPVS